MNNNSQNLINFLDDLKRNRQKKLNQHKKNGKIIAGYFCNYTPPEIIEACGAIPIRILEDMNHSNETQGRKFIQRDSCSFCKSALGSLFKNNNFSCVVSGTTCDQMRRLHECISEKVKLPVFLFNNPRTFGKKSTTELFKREMKWIISELTDLTKQDYSEEALSQRIKQWNRLKNFLLKIHFDRQHKNPPISGKVMFRLIETAFFLGPDLFLEYSNKIENILNRSDKRVGNEPIRLLFAGSILTSNDDLILDLIEENKQAVIVTDNICTGTKWFNFTVEEEGNCLDNIVQTYHKNMICPHRRPNNPLFDFTKEQIDQWKPDGIIYRTLKFCHPWTFEVQAFKDRFGLPLLHLDSDYSNSNIGQLRTRIQAFIEMLKSKKETIEANPRIRP